jgi:RNA polymerase sigma-70 factor (ECF subfamily)
MDDRVLLDQIAIGDRGAFDALTDRYYVHLCAFALDIAKSREAAEDIVQDSFVSLWVNRRKLSGIFHGKAYLYTTVKNRAFTWLRANTEKSTDDGIPPEKVSEDDIARYFIEQETFRLVMEAIDRLPPRTAEVLRLSLEGLRQEQIGEQMGITVATVKLLKSEGLKKLRQQLGYLRIFLLFI